MKKEEEKGPGTAIRPLASLYMSHIARMNREVCKPSLRQLLGKEWLSFFQRLMRAQILNFSFH